MEQSFLAYLRGRCRSLPQVSVGIGDDAAIIDPPSFQTDRPEPTCNQPTCNQPVSHQVVACTDQIIDGVDFLSDGLADSGYSLADVGYKAMAINLSDIAAMGAQPKSALVTLSLPKSNATRIAGEVYEGIFEAAQKYGVAIAGGDLSTYDGPLAISVTLLGEVPSGGAWLRSGAQVGDAVLVTGAFGGSLIGRHLRPLPQIAVARWLRQHVSVTAAIDVSDGLSLDLDRLLAKSGVGIEMSIGSIPIHADAEERSAKTGKTPFEHAWSDGEDFELIVTMSQADAEVAIAGLSAEQHVDESEGDGVDASDITRTSTLTKTGALTKIGTVTSRTGLWKLDNGRHERLSPQGYIH